MRISFFVRGNRVQNVGLRVKTMLLINSMKLVGFVENVPTGKTVSVEAWGGKKALLDLYSKIRKLLPQDSLLTEPFFDYSKMITSKNEMRNLMYFQLEQMDKFIGVGQELGEKIREMGKQVLGTKKAVAGARREIAWIRAGG